MTLYVRCRYEALDRLRDAPDPRPAVPLVQLDHVQLLSVVHRYGALAGRCKHRISNVPFTILTRENERGISWARGTYHRRDKVPYTFPMVAGRRSRRRKTPRRRCQEETSSIPRDQIPGYSWNCASVP